MFGFCGVCYSWHFHRQASGGVGLGRYWSIRKISAVDVLSNAGKLAFWRESRRGVMNDCSPDSRSPLGVFPGLGRPPWPSELLGFERQQPTACTGAASIR